MYIIYIYILYIMYVYLFIYFRNLLNPPEIIEKLMNIMQTQYKLAEIFFIKYLQFNLLKQ